MRFKVGDKIKCINNIGTTLKENFVYTVTKAYESPIDVRDRIYVITHFDREDWFYAHRFILTAKKEPLTFGKALEILGLN